MDWKIFLIKFLRNLVFGTALGGVILGIIGFLLAGKAGFINMAIWGLALGLLGSLSTGLAMLVNVHYWTGYAERFGEDSFKKVSEGEQEKRI
jgi:hypothetical protein